MVISQIPAFLDVEPPTPHAPRTLWRGAWSSDGHLSSAPGTHRSETGRLCARSSFLCRAECPASHPRLPLSSSARPLTGTCLRLRGVARGDAGRGLCVLSRRGDGVLLRLLGGNTSVPKPWNSCHRFFCVVYLRILETQWIVFLLHLPLKHLSFKLSGLQEFLLNACVTACLS